MNKDCKNCGKKAEVWVKSISVIAERENQVFYKDFEAMQEYTRRELVKIAQKQVDENLRDGEELYCKKCSKKLIWKVYNE